MVRMSRALPIPPQRPLQRNSPRAPRTKAAALALAAILALAFPASSQVHELARPLRISFITAEGERTSGELAAWDRETLWLIHADERRAHAWRSLEARSAYELRRRLIGVRDAQAWLELGALMLAMGNRSLAEQAFAVASRLDASTKQSADRAREAASQGRDPVSAIEPDPEDDPSEPATNRPARQTTPSGGDDDAPTGPDMSGSVRGRFNWPVATPAELAQQTAEVKEHCERYLERSGFKIPLIETENFLMYSDLQPFDVRRWSRELDKLYDTMQEVLEIERGSKIFHGKCAIFIFKERVDFIAFEHRAFEYDASRAGGLCHMRGPMTFVVFYKSAEDARFQSVLVHETTHAFMYRYRSPYPLPTWANEGLADYIAGHLTPRSLEPQEHWQHARNFIMRGGDPLAIMAQTYTAGTWPNEDSYPISHMIVRFMLKHKPRAFKQWIDDIKAGVPWELSMAERFGVTKERLAQGFDAEMRSEPRYTRLR